MKNIWTTLGITFLAVAGHCSLYASGSDDQNFYNKVKVVFTAPAPILSSKVSSEVTSINKRFGESFKKGDILITMDATFYKANLAAAKSVAHASKVKLNAVKSLYDDANASLVEYELTLSQQAVSIKNSIEAEEQLAGCTVVAPFDGRVVRVVVNEHELVKSDTPLMKIINDTTLLAQFLLPEMMFKDVKPDTEVTIYVNSLKRSFKGRIKYIAAEIDPASQTFEVQASVDNSGGDLRSGMNAEIDIEMLRKSLK